MKEADFDVDLRHNVVHPGLVVLAEEPNLCPRCQQPLEQQMIEYASWQARAFRDYSRCADAVLPKSP